LPLGERSDSDGDHQRCQSSLAVRVAGALARHVLHVESRRTRSEEAFDDEMTMTNPATKVVRTL